MLPQRVSDDRIKEWKTQYAFVSEHGVLNLTEQSFMESVKGLLDFDTQLSYRQSSWLRGLYHRTQQRVG